MHENDLEHMLNSSQLNINNFRINLTKINRFVSIKLLQHEVLNKD